MNKDKFQKKKSKLQSLTVIVNNAIGNIAIVNNTTIGNIAFVNTAIGNIAFVNTALGNIAFVNTAIGDIAFVTAAIGNIASVIISANTVIFSAAIVKISRPKIFPLFFLSCPNFGNIKIPGKSRNFGTRPSLL